MNRQRVNFVSGIVPIVLSLVAFGVVIIAVLTGWDAGDQDEGAPAHIFQLSIVAEVPFLLAFLATANWEKVGRVAGLLALEAAALALAFAPVAIFGL